MNIYEFANENGFGLFILSWMLLHYIFKSWNRLMRHLNIRKYGWPPPHCDADGDFKEEPTKEDEEK